MNRRIFYVGLTGLCLQMQAPASAAVPAGFNELTYASGFSEPTAMAFAPDGRLFICEKTGKVRVVSAAGVLQTAAFIDLTSRISQGNERGLLGIAFDPNFASNRFLYVFYSANSPAPHSRVSRLTASASNPNVAEAGSEVEIFNMSNLSSNDNHNGGAIHFGKDGKLYVASGDNRDPANATRMTNTHGKIHRINPDGSIPPDNPTSFRSNTGATLTPAAGMGTMWAIGFRNPFTFGVQPGTGRIFANDVGEGSAEEISDITNGGGNYGWPTCEGFCGTLNANLIEPLYEYGHGEGCAITGGAFYNPPAAQFPASYVGKYFFADLCSNWIRLFDPSNNTATGFGTGFSGPVDFAVGPDGALYVLMNGNSTVRKIQYVQNQPPQIVTQPAAQTAGVGQTATFSVSATGTPPLSFQWQKNGANIAGATAATYTTPPLARTDSGAAYRCVVSNSFGSATSNAAVLTVTGAAPQPVINTPALPAFYIAGQPVAFSGGATDAEDGPLAAAALTWDVDFYHDDSGVHRHPGDPPVSGATSGSFTPSQTEEFSPNVWYRVNLTARDSEGLTATVFRDVFPRVSTLTFATNPPGLQILVDGIPITGPKTVLGVQGVIRTLAAPATQTVSSGFQESNGQVVMEAESFSGNTPVSANQWAQQTSPAGFSGAGVMAVVPDAGNQNNTNFPALSPGLSFDVNFSAGGTYYIWVRGQGPDDAGDSVHVGLNGQAVSTADNISSFPAGSFNWSGQTMDGPVATLTVPGPGAHTVNVWMREDGFLFDKLLLTTNANLTPSGAGPAESGRVNSAAYEFVSWSDGGAAQHSVTTPAAATTYTAIYRILGSDPPPAAPKGLRRR